MANPTGVGTIVHGGVSVRGLLRRPRGQLRRTLVDPDTGRSLSPDEAREKLMDLLASGVEMLPLGEPCEGWSDKTGCPGHPGEASHE